MLKNLIKSDLFMLKKGKLIYACIILSMFYMVALSLTYNYDFIKAPIRAGQNIIPSLNNYTQFIFRDFSLIIPLTIIIIFYLSNNLSRYSILLAQGISRTTIYFSRLITIYIITTTYLIINICVTYSSLGVMIYKYQLIDYSLSLIILFLFVQIICFLAYTTLIYLISIIAKKKSLVILVITIASILLMINLTKLTTAIGLQFSLYNYWIIGLTTQMNIDTLMFDINKIVLILISYFVICCPLSFFIFQKTRLVEHSGGLK